MSDRPTTLLLGGVEQIQRYLTVSPRLKQIRGASSLLVEIERAVKRRLVDAGGEVGRAAAGAFLAEFADKAEAERCVGWLRRQYALRAPGARLRAAIYDRPAGQPFSDALERARLELERAPEPSEPVFDVPFVLPCDVCRSRPARAPLPPPSGGERACVECLARHHADIRLSDRLDAVKTSSARTDDLSSRGRIELRLGKLGVLPEVNRAEGKRAHPTVSDVNPGGRPPGYVGYVAADGNAVGEALSAVGGLDGYRTFSEALDRATEEALVGAVQAVAADPRASTQRLCVLPVLVGGDDLLVYCSPALALPLAVEFGGRFERAARERLADDPDGARVLEAVGTLGTGIGVVIAHATTPFGYLDERAHRLQREAKALSRRAPRRGQSAVAFEILHETAGGLVDPLGRPDHYAGLPAYVVDASGQSLDARTLVKAAWDLRASRPPWSRLKRLHGVLAVPGKRGADEYQLLLKPLEDGQRKPFTRIEAPPPGWEPAEHPPWLRPVGGDGQHRTAVTDLVALAEVS